MRTIHFKNNPWTCEKLWWTRKEKSLRKKTSSRNKLVELCGIVTYKSHWYVICARWLPHLDPSSSKLRLRLLDQRLTDKKTWRKWRADFGLRGWLTLRGWHWLAEAQLDKLDREMFVQTTSDKPAAALHSKPIRNQDFQDKEQMEGLLEVKFIYRSFCLCVGYMV